MHLIFNRSMSYGIILGQRNDATLFRDEVNPYIQQKNQVQLFKVNDNPQE